MVICSVLRFIVCFAEVRCLSVHGRADSIRSPRSRVAAVHAVPSAHSHNRHGILLAFFQSHDVVIHGAATYSQLELEADLEAHFLKGAGTRLSYGLSCTLLEDIFEELDEIISGQQHNASVDGQTFAHFRFGHAETLLPIISLLVSLPFSIVIACCTRLALCASACPGAVFIAQGLYPSHPLPQYTDYVNGGGRMRGLYQGGGDVWSSAGSVVIPMAANIIILLHRCDNGSSWEVTVNPTRMIVIAAVW